MSSRNPQGRLSRTMRQSANELFLKMENNLDDYEGRCLFVVDENGGYCNEPVTNNCHIVSESNVLHKLREHESQEVLALSWGVSRWRELLFGVDPEGQARNPATYEPYKKPTHDACVGWFACKRNAHDDKFQRIDVAEPNIDDEQSRFLFAYRLVLYWADQYRQGLEFYSQQNEAVLEGTRPEHIPWWRGQKDRLEKGLGEAAEKVALLGKDWYARENGGTFDANLVSAKALDFRSKLRLAGGVFYGSHVFVTVFPTESDRHKMALVYLTSEADLAEKEIGSLAHPSRVSQARDNYGVFVARALMTNGWGDLAASERSYNELGNKERSTINGLVARHAQPGPSSRATRRQFQRGNRT